VLDFRGNAPALRIERTSVVDGVRVDATGWREAVRVDGRGRVVATLRRCSLSSSGDDGALVSGAATLRLADCTVAAGRHGVVAAERACAGASASR
jgi:hypothetical protein